MKINFDLNNSLKDLQNLLKENLVKQKCKETVTASQSTGSILANKDGEINTVSRCSGLDIIEVEPKALESLNTKSDASNEVIGEVVEVGPEKIGDSNPTVKVHPETFIEIKNLSRNEVIEKLASLNITFDLSMSLTDLINQLGENLVKLKCKEPVIQLTRLDRHPGAKNKVQGIAMKRYVSNSVETIDLDERDNNPNQNRQNVETNLPCNDLSRIEKLEKMNLSNNPTSKAPFVTSMEYSGQSPNETKNLSRIEVIEKLVSMKINFDLSTSLTDLQNLLRENLIKIFKCKEPVTTSSQSTSYFLDQEKQSNKEIGSTTTVSRSRNDLLSNSYKEYLSKKTEGIEKLASSVSSVNKVQGMAKKRNVSNTVETIDLVDKSDSIPTKRGLTDEDVTCEICLQAFGTNLSSMNI